MCSLMKMHTTKGAQRKAVRGASCIWLATAVLTSSLNLGATANGQTVANVPPILTRINSFLYENGEAAILVKNNNYSFEDLRRRSDLSDANDDALSFRIVSVDSGTLKLNGAPVTAGVSMIVPDDVVTWMPDGAGMSVRGFTLDAYDGTSYSAAPVAVNFDVTWNLLQDNNPPTIFSGEFLNSTKDLPLTITWKNLMNATLASDVEGDQIFFRITQVSAGQLTKDGTPVVAGETVVGPHQSLVWTAPAGSLDSVIDAFSVKASDLQDTSANEVSIGIAVGGNHPPIFTGVDPFLRTNFEAVHVSEVSRYSFNQLYRRSDLVDIDDDAVTFRVASIATGELLINGVVAVAGVSTIGPSDSIVWIPAAVGARVTAFSLDAFDGKEYSTNSVPVIFDVYNPTPSFTRGTDISILRGDEIRGYGTIANWARNIQPYDGALTFVISNDNPNLFVSQPEVTAEGTLQYGVDSEAYGTANVSITLIDDQGRHSQTVTLKFDVLFVNWPPYVENQSAVTVSEDGGFSTIPNFISYADTGSSWEDWQTLTYTVIPGNAALYNVKPYVDAAGTLYFKTATNAAGIDNLRLIVKDNGGTLNHGMDTTVARFAINVVPANDPPTIKNTVFDMVENTTLQANLIVADPDDDPANAVISVVSFDPEFFTSAQVTKSTVNTLSITPVAGHYGNTLITLSATDGKNSAEFTIPVIVTNINHPPHFSLNTTRVVGDYVTGKITVPNAVTLIDKGGRNENAQIVSYLATSSAPLSFRIKPTITADGTLSYQLLDTIAEGTEISVFVVAKDNGRSNNISAPQTLTIVAPSNPFGAAKGVYNGLFYDANGVQNSSAGSYTATVTDRGIYSGKISIEGLVRPFSGRFSTEKNSRVTIVRLGKSALSLELSLSSNQITGGLSDGVWSAQLAADKAVYSLANPTPAAGKYTVAIPQSDEGPSGNSVAVLNVLPDGRVISVANLADGTTVSQTTTLSSQNQWPLFASLYRGNGCLISWVTLANNGNASVTGEINWIKAQATNGPEFSAQSTLDGSIFTPPTLGKRVLESTNLVVVVDVPNSDPISIPATITAKNTILVQNTALARLSLNLTTGLIAGTVYHGTSGIAVKAVVLQQQNKLSGYSLDQTASGAVYNQ